MDKRLIFLIEILIWLFLIAGLAIFSVYVKSTHDVAHNSYYIFFNDVDGLVKGSQVRVMGLEIGYIQDIRVFDNKVFVSFLVTKKNFPVPKHAIATVEFYGLGGSVSLELTPVSASESGEGNILTKEPYRIKDYYDTSKDISILLMNMYNGLGHAMDKSKIFEHKDLLKPSHYTVDALEIMDKTDDTLVKTIYSYYELKSRSVKPKQININPDELEVIEQEPAEVKN